METIDEDDICKCAICNKEVSIFAARFEIPTGWYKIDVEHATDDENSDCDDEIVCSIECAVKFLQNLA